MPIKIDGISYSLLNTCPFDSVFQILCTAYVDNLEYAQFINSKIEEELIFKTVAHAIRDGINAQTYIRRGTLLKSLHQPMKCSEYLVTVNCATTVCYIIKELFKCYPSYEEEITCRSCKTYYTRKHTTILADLPTNTLDVLEDMVKQILSNGTIICNKCHSPICSKEIINVGKQLFIETSVPYETAQKQNDNFDISVTLESIPKQIKIDQAKHYTLRGVISFIPPISKSHLAIGHYISYCWREHIQKWERFDDTAKVEKSIRQSTVVPCQFLIY